MHPVLTCKLKNKAKSSLKTVLRTCEAVLPEAGDVYTRDEVPEQFWEPSILGGYRHPRSSPAQCLLSIFQGTNETLNFWTHFLPSWYFMWRLRCLNETHAFNTDPYSWPLLTLLFGACLYPLASALAHTFNTMSLRARHVCFFLDYAALSLYSFAGAVSYTAYVLPSSWFGSTHGSLYLPLSFIVSVLCTLCSCRSRFMPPGVWRKVNRLGAFALPFFVVSAPVAERALSGSEGSGEALCYLRWVFAWAGMAALLYALHLPERWVPGKFDVLGHSHQWFHLCTVFGTAAQIAAVHDDMVTRKDALLSSNHLIPGFWGSVGAILVLTLVNACIVWYFSVRAKKELACEQNGLAVNVGVLDLDDGCCSGHLKRH